MTFLPIVDRELREAARRRSTHWIRLEAAAVALVIGVFFLLSEQHRAPQFLGKILFGMLAGFVLLQALLAGAWRTADCISEEKREGTLGLLFLTDLKGYDIVLGKLAATSLNVFYGLLAVLPVMALPLLMGGVTLTEFLRVTLAALNNLFFSLAVGMFFSSVSRDERRAMTGAFLFILAITAVVPAVAGIMTAVRNWAEPPWWVMVVSPGLSSVLAFEGTFAGTGVGARWYYVSLGVVHGMGWLLLGLACVIIPRSWQEKGRREAAEGTGSRARTTRDAFRRHWLERNPFTWLALRGPGKCWLVWLFLGIGAALWLWGWVKMKRDWTIEPTYILTGLAVHTVLKLWVTSEATRRLTQDRRSGALELILSTPLTVPEIIRGQLGALWRQFAGPVAVVLAVDLMFLLDSTRDSELVMVFIVGMISLVGDLVALAWVGMWAAMKTSTVNRASAVAVLQVLVLPWVVFVGTTILVGLAGMFHLINLHSHLEEEFLVFYWLALSLAANLFFGLRARAGLRDRFRATAAGH